MKALTLALFASAALAADITVCASGCTYTTMQAAIDAAMPGDTITLAAGQVFNSNPFTLKRKPGANWITIRSSRWRELPENYRPAADDARLATLAFTASGQALISFEADPVFSSNCWSSQRDGNTVTIGYLHSPALPCEARLKNGMLYDSTAPLGTVTLLGAAVPTAGTYGGQGNGLRVGLGTNGKLWISHKSDIVPGVHFTCTNCETGKQDTWIHFNFPEDSLALVTIGYDTAGAVTGIGDKRVWHSGPWAGKTDVAGLFPGILATAYKGPATGVHHYRFVGVHFRYNSTTQSYYGQMFQKSQSADYRYVPHHLDWDRCVFSQPKASVGFWRWIGMYHGDHVSIRSSRFLNTQSQSEGQAILTCGGLGPVILENIEIDGATESFLAGGCNGGVVAVPQITARRSLFRKRMEQRPLVRVVRQISTGTLALTTQDGVTRCDTGTCTVHYEDTPYVYSHDSSITVTAGAAAKLYLGVSPSGVLTAGHNSGAAVLCSGDIVCLSGVTGRAGMAEYAMLYEWTAAAGAWNATFDWYIGSGVLLKNLFELKTGRDVIFEGNLLRNYWAAGGQGTALLFSARNQNGLDVFVRLDGLDIRRNKLVNLHAAIAAFGLDDMGGNTFGRGFRFNHNIVLDASKTRWGNFTSGGQAFGFGSGGILAVGIEHNTAESDRLGFNQYTSSPLNSFHTNNNLWIWNPPEFYGGSYSGQGLVAGFISVRKSDWAVTAYGYVGPTSVYRGNLNLAPGSIPGNGWNNWIDDSSRNFTANQRMQSANLTNQFVSWGSPAGLGANVRLKPASAYSVHCTSGCDTQLATTTGLDPGADVDWVETLVDGVNEGLPERGKRLALHVEAGAAGAVFSLATSDPVTLKVSTHQNMKSSNLVANTGTPDVADGGRKVFAVAGLTGNTRYWYTVETGGGAVKDHFTTAAGAANPVFTVVLKPTSGEVVNAVVDYGVTPALGSTSEAKPCASGCSIGVPWAAGAFYYRARYRNGAGEDLFRSATLAAVP